MKFRKKPVIIDATRWFKNGDHPEDYSKDHDGLENGEMRVFTAAYRKERNWEGDIVRYFRRPDVLGTRSCQHCDKTMHEHGWIDTKEGGHVVCSGNWIITGVKGELYPCREDIFVFPTGVGMNRKPFVRRRSRIMRKFICEKCGKEIFDSLGYVTECEHYPSENRYPMLKSNSIESNSIVKNRYYTDSHGNLYYVENGVSRKVTYIDSRHLNTIDVLRELGMEWIEPKDRI